MRGIATRAGLPLATSAPAALAFADVHSLYALNDRPELPRGATPAAVRAALAAHVITAATLTGLYRR